MPVQILQNCKLYLAQFDLSGDVNQVALDHDVEIKEITPFGSAAKKKIAGLENTAVKAKGFINVGLGAVEETLWNKFAVADQPLTICPLTGADGEVAFSLQSLLAQYSPGAAVGDVFGFDVTAEGSGPLVRGTLMATGAKTVTGTGTARQLGAVAAGQKLYAALHVLSKAGTSPTLDMKIQSDDAQAFTTPIDRITFAQATDIGAQWATPVNGPITDTWWRASWAIGGTGGPSFTVALVVGIRS